MKIRHQAMLEAKTLDKFSDKCKELNINKHRVVEKLLEDWLQSNEARIIKCALCGSEYSNILEDCPKCKEDKEIALMESNLDTVNKRLEKLESFRKRGMAVSDHEIQNVRAKRDILNKQLVGLKGEVDKNVESEKV